MIKHLFFAIIGSFGGVKVYAIEDVDPALEITGKPTEWTNQNVTLTVTVEGAEGLTVITKPDNSMVMEATTTYEVSENGEYTFKALNGTTEVEKTIVVEKIDKTPPTKPSLRIEDNLIVVTPGADSESGILKHNVRTSFNPSTWYNYNPKVPSSLEFLLDGIDTYSKL